MNQEISKNQKDNVIGLYVIQRVLENRKKVLLITGIFLLVGIIFTTFSEDNYTANSVFIPQIQNTNKASSGGLGNIASLAGISLNGNLSSSDFPPNLYPTILRNVNFKLALIQAPLVFGDSEVTYQEYYEELYRPSALSRIKAILKKYTIGLPNLIFSNSPEVNNETGNQKVDERSLVRLTSSQLEHFQRLESQVSILSNIKDGFVTISVNMAEPELAAQMTLFVEEELEKALIAYKVENAKTHLDFIEDRYKVKKIEFEQAQNKLAVFRDRNLGLKTAIAEATLQKLVSEHDLAFGLYLDLAKEREQAKLEVSRNTPIISVIQPVVIPSSKSGRGDLLIWVIFAFIGLVIYPIKLYLQYVLPMLL